MIKLNNLNQAIQRAQSRLIKESFMLEGEIKPSGTVATSTIAEPESKPTYKDVIDGMMTATESVKKDAIYAKLHNDVRFWDALRELVERNNQARPANEKRPPLDEKRPPNANVFIGTLLAAKLHQAGAVLPEWCHCSPIVPIDAIIIFYEDIAKNSNGGLNRGFY